MGSTGGLHVMESMHGGNIYFHFSVVVEPKERGPRFLEGHRR